MAVFIVIIIKADLLKLNNKLYKYEDVVHILRRHWLENSIRKDLGSRDVKRWKCRRLLLQANAPSLSAWCMVKWGEKVKQLQ